MLFKSESKVFLKVKFCSRYYLFRFQRQWNEFFTFENFSDLLTAKKNSKIHFRIDRFFKTKMITNNPFMHTVAIFYIVWRIQIVLILA